MSMGILNAFWSTILRLAGVMAIVSLGLNLIYGFNGQFSLGQFGFYAIGAYTAADITYRWTQLHNALGLTVILFAGLLVGAAIMAVGQLVGKMRGLDTLSAFALYLGGVLVAVLIAIRIGTLASAPVTALLATLPENIALTIVYLFAVLLGGIDCCRDQFSIWFADLYTWDQTILVLPPWDSRSLLKFCWITRIPCSALRK